MPVLGAFPIRFVGGLVGAARRRVGERERVFDHHVVLAPAGARVATHARLYSTIAERSATTPGPNRPIGR
jgi:hypothetical protein